MIFASGAIDQPDLHALPTRRSFDRGPGGGLGLGLAVALVVAKGGHRLQARDVVDRSIDRLYRLNHAFSVYESQIEWTDKDVSPEPSVLVDR